MPQLDPDTVKNIQNKLKEISDAKSDYEIYRDFIISCKRTGVSIPDKIQTFIISDLESQQK